VAEAETPFSQVPEPGVGEHPVPITDADAVVRSTGAAAGSIRRLPTLVRIALVILGIVIVVGLPFVALLSS
jgi:hypothetical protein